MGVQRGRGPDAPNDMDIQTETVPSRVAATDWPRLEDLHCEHKYVARPDVGALAAVAVAELGRDVHLPPREIRRGGGAGSQTERCISMGWLVRICPPPRKRGNHQIMRIGGRGVATDLSPSTMSCIASVQPPMTWFGANDVGSLRAYDESKVLPFGLIDHSCAVRPS